MLVTVTKVPVSVLSGGGLTLSPTKWQPTFNPTPECPVQLRYTHVRGQYPRPWPAFLLSLVPDPLPPTTHAHCARALSHTHALSLTHRHTFTHSLAHAARILTHIYLCSCLCWRPCVLHNMRSVPRKPGMTRQDLFEVNATLNKNFAKAVAKNCPGALVAIISNPVRTCTLRRATRPISRSTLPHLP